MSESVRSIDTPSYHIWTDAVHARELARRTPDRWDRGSYVRWAVISAWTAFETACEMALAATGLGNRFKKNLDKSVASAGLPAIDWSQGLWQQVLEVYQLRKDYVHRSIPQARLFAPVEEADLAITVLRQAIKDIFRLSGDTGPNWVEYDSDDGWSGGLSSKVHATVVRAGVNGEDPETIRVSYIYKGEEKVSEILPPGADWEPVLERLLNDVVVPISAVRAYRGKTLLKDIPMQMRGS